MRERKRGQKEKKRGARGGARGGALNVRQREGLKVVVAGDVDHDGPLAALHRRHRAERQHAQHQRETRHAGTLCYPKKGNMYYEDQARLRKGARTSEEPILIRRKRNRLIGRTRAPPCSPPHHNSFSLILTPERGEIFLLLDVRLYQ